MALAVPTKNPGQPLLPRDQVLDLDNFCGLQTKIEARKIGLHVRGVSGSRPTSSANLKTICGVVRRCRAAT